MFQIDIEEFSPASLLLKRTCHTGHSLLAPAHARTETDLCHAGMSLWGSFHFLASAPETSLASKWVFVSFANPMGYFGFAVNPFEYLKKTNLITH